MAFVAHAGAGFMGMASLIANDMDERPALSPWIAAVWVEPDFRQQGVGSALVRAAADAAFALGFDPIYLYALPTRTAFYQRIGWSTVERDVGGLNIFQMQRAGHKVPR